MAYTKELPTVSGWYWMKWGDYSAFVAKIEIDDKGPFTVWSGDGKTKVYVGEDENHSYSSEPIPEPV